MSNFPQNRQWTQNSSGEVFGILHSTRNINFDKEGYAQLAKRTNTLIYDTTGFGDVTSISYFKPTSGSTGYYVTTVTKPWRVTLDSITPVDLTGDTNGGSISTSLKLDGLVWQGRWYVSQDTSLAYNNGNGTWTTGVAAASLTTNKFHPMCVMENLNFLAVGNNNSVVLFDTGHSVSTTLTIPSNYEVRWMRYTNGYLYIGTKNITGGDAQMFIWNGSGTAAQFAWPVQGNWMWSGVVYDSSIVVCTSKGQLLRFNGGGWTSLVNFPVYYSSYSWYQGIGFTNGRMEQRGMVVDGDVIYMIIDGFVGDENVWLDNQPSGLWVFDPKVGLYHKGGFATAQWKNIDFTEASTNTTTNTFTAGSSYTALSGTKVFYTASSASGGLTSNKYYFLIRVTNTTFQLASTYANAIAGTAIDITSAGTTEFLYYSNETDFGDIESISFHPGAICLISDLDSNPKTYGYTSGSEVLFGGGDVPNADFSASKDTIQTLTVGLNRGYFVTQKIFSDNVQENWLKVFAKFNRLFQSSDKVIIKYRKNDKPYYPICIRNNGVTWTSSTVFTTTADLSAVVEGEEVEVTGGSGTGCIAHVSGTPVNNAGTWTVTLDEAIIGITASDKSGVVIQNFTKIAKVIGSDLKGFKEAPIPLNGTWVQYKIEMRGHSEPYIDSIQNPSKPHQFSA